MNMSDVAAQMVSILVSAIGLVIFRLIARYIPEDPPPVPRRPDHDAEIEPTAEKGPADGE
ncbi:hypothetical protein [Actinacidiphila sp. ITFR-21]|uniref:hypothetical protein n=1 Tax=Actinacidiphila sp. ITFR-21 TaxID=3075199 RepID=UPI0028897951|nr:hypothetical protein [Streptomyces sp. ITFR-21]WNI17574.1 hypothetical protein RLT57_20000 [Streptomyces sp. ITFR-21]WNI17714.1 hypothetical protein RLT57_20715 [Streptomyces sp. ITFR-21]